MYASTVGRLAGRLSPSHVSAPGDFYQLAEDAANAWLSHHR
jgi:hypothetical protein